jgi:hypothetical protein
VSALLRQVPSVPPGFVDRFLADGWRGVERVYGCRTDLLLKWIEMSGGAELYQRRREHMKANGIRPFGRGGNGAKSKAIDTASWLDR